MRNCLNLILAAASIFCALPAAAADALDPEGFPIMYVRGIASGNWGVNENFRFTRNGAQYSITLAQLDGEFKISGSTWQYNYGAPGTSMMEVSKSAIVDGTPNGPNLIAKNLTDVTITFTLPDNFSSGLVTTPISITLASEQPVNPDADLNPAGLSGTLPVLYIRVLDASGTYYNDEIISKDLSHKNYFAGDYFLDMNGCEWLAAEGAESLGSADNRLPLEIKARGNFTRLAFAKKPFKLKLGKKQSMLGLSKSKHFALLAHADDNFGYLRNFTGFDLGRRIGLPWTPWQQPVEVVINGNYRGLYFLTESIRVEDNRVNIAQQEDLCSDPALASGGYIIELDNYDETNQIRMEEKSCAPGYPLDKLRVTWDTPEEYSELQKEFITQQFTQMNDYVGSCDDRLWSYMAMDDAARYYLVEEIISNSEAYHGSTYLFRNRGEGKMWHFSPLWDCGNAFNGATDRFLYDNNLYGNTWIPSMRRNAKFNARVKETWMWFMTNRFDGLTADIDSYISHIAAAAVADHNRWKNAPLPNYPAAQPVTDNSDITARRDNAMNHLSAKINWLKNQFGDFSALTVPAAEPAPDTTVPAPLPDFMTGGVSDIISDQSEGDSKWFNLQGIQLKNPRRGEVLIKVSNGKAEKVIMR